MVQENSLVAQHWLPFRESENWSDLLHDESYYSNISETTSAHWKKHLAPEVLVAECSDLVSHRLQESSTY